MKIEQERNEVEIEGLMTVMDCGRPFHLSRRQVGTMWSEMARTTLPEIDFLSL
ncbi:MAG: hypothetical protein ACLVJ6_16965 [Merdibacter sp.]